MSNSADELFDQLGPQEHDPEDPLGSSVGTDWQWFGQGSEEAIQAQIAVQRQSDALYQVAIEQLAKLDRMQQDAIREELRAMSTLNPVRAEMPSVMLTPDGHVDFTYIQGRLVTGGACSLSDVGDIPFSRVVKQFEYWEKCPPAHETLVKISEQLDTLGSAKRNVVSTESQRSPAGLSPLSQREVFVHDAVGKDRFGALTNADIMRDRTLRKRLRNEFHLKTADAAKACLDRIRKGKGYLLSGEIKIKRSGH